MKVIHIIPSAFNYFDDIRSRAFKLVENLHELGIEADAFTLQYGSSGSSQQFQKNVHDIAPSRQFVGMVKGAELINALSDYTLVHLHCPFLGVARSLWRFKQAHPEIPLIATYYRDAVTSDLFGWCIKWYNNYYLPKIFSVADVVAYEPGREAERAVAKYVKNFSKLVEVDDSASFLGASLTAGESEVHPGGEMLLALKYKMLYNLLAREK